MAARPWRWLSARIVGLLSVRSRLVQSLSREQQDQ